MLNKVKRGNMLKNSQIPEPQDDFSSKQEDLEVKEYLDNMETYNEYRRTESE